jgi:hypothetical protein
VVVINAGTVSVVPLTAAVVLVLVSVADDVATFCHSATCTLIGAAGVPARAEMVSVVTPAADPGLVKSCVNCPLDVTDGPATHPAVPEILSDTLIAVTPPHEMATTKQLLAREALGSGTVALAPGPPGPSVLYGSL